MGEKDSVFALGVIWIKLSYRSFQGFWTSKLLALASLFNLRNNFTMIKTWPLLLTCSLLGASCASKPSYYSKVKESPDFLSEKEVLRKRLNGKFPCIQPQLPTFLWHNTTPDKQCLYLNTGGVNNQGVTNGSLVKVLQALPQGYLLHLPYQSCNRYGCVNEVAPYLIFLHKTDEKEELIDGKFLSEFHHWDFFEYVGPYSYQSGIGPKTIYSFKRIPNETIKTHQQDFKKYSIWLEIFEKTGAWAQLKEIEEVLEKKRDNNSKDEVQ